MHIASLGVSKFCFLISLAFCGFLLLIPVLKPPAHQVDLPKPRPQVRLPQTDPSLDAWFLEVSANKQDRSSVQKSEMSSNDVHESLELKDIFIAVKTTKKYHRSRLKLLIETFQQYLHLQTYIFTDSEDVALGIQSGVTLINTNCSAAHTRQALCCKMSVEYDKFIESQKKWFCHVDDDNYMVLPSLLRLLSSYHHSQDVYLGRPSLDHPIEAAEKVKNNGMTPVKFWFATGGAGFCISRGLALKMSPWASLGNFITTAEKIRLPDDCTIGYIIEVLLDVHLTHTYLFHSHLENLHTLPIGTVLQQFTVGFFFSKQLGFFLLFYCLIQAQLPGRFKTVHCLLYPDAGRCPEQQNH
uniref:RFNG O-fucosylpeptide 3-beta-N-acetylglucosaminyltransferase n=1 Tax=Tetraodon nigroviridis TaxID=99883 RepID=H3C3K1_TETNG